ncbi:YuzF family protein [Bacillus sp. DJP31]|uniref:YuzF family protein n=1 Tax=Bacillus sp. DJP31 TaxID=3409789 RepID=UPI003BB7D2D2
MMNPNYQRDMTMSQMPMGQMPMNQMPMNMTATSMTKGMPMQWMVVEPYVLQALMTLMGKEVVLETSRGNIRGVVMDVKPDHVVLQAGDSTFFIRLCEVIWIMPE